MQVVTGQLVNISERRVYPAIVSVENGKIARIDPLLEVTRTVDGVQPGDFYIMPGFVDAHVHIESSMLVPAEFARLAVVHGTVGTVSDPHEIANVCGIAGVEYMIDNGSTVPFKFNFGAPSCVPATTFETAGAMLDAEAVTSLLQRSEIKYLSEMMNFPGVLQHEAEVMRKIAAAHKLGKPVDGHAPGLRGEQARQYIAAGISTDHECFTVEEALEKLQYGMKILIREGSAAKNFEALASLLHDHAGEVMFCTDDKHPDSLAEGHINRLCARAVAKGIDVFNVLQAACINPVLHYGLNIGLLREGDAADFVLVEDLKDFKVVQTYIDGLLVASEGKATPAGRRPLESHKAPTINRFNCRERKPADFIFPVPAEAEQIPVIEALDGQLITNRLALTPKVSGTQLISDPGNDVLKIVVVNRYNDAPVAKAFIKGFGLQSGAIASSVAHDSHNIVAVGVDDESLCRAINLVIKEKGGISCIHPFAKTGAGGMEAILPLPVGGIMSMENGYDVAAAYTAIDAMAKDAGAVLSAPFMTLSFMALLVIPHLKLSDKGLFDGDRFALM